MVNVSSLSNYDNESLINNDGKDFIKIFIKNIHTKRVKPNKYVYHCSDFKNRNSILEHGLKLTDHSDSNYKHESSLVYPPSIFATNDGKDSIWGFGNDDIWEIDTEKLPNKWWYDLNLYNNGHETISIMTFEPIPPKFIKLISEY
jgi:hypothetical protein